MSMRCLATLALCLLAAVGRSAARPQPTGELDLSNHPPSRKLNEAFVPAGEVACCLRSLSACSCASYPAVPTPLLPALLPLQSKTFGATSTAPPSALSAGCSQCPPLALPTIQNSCAPSSTPSRRASSFITAPRAAGTAATGTSFTTPIPAPRTLTTTGVAASNPAPPYNGSKMRCARRALKPLPKTPPSAASPKWAAATGSWAPSRTPPATSQRCPLARAAPRWPRPTEWAAHTRCRSAASWPLLLLRAGGGWQGWRAPKHVRSWGGNRILVCLWAAQALAVSRPAVPVPPARMPLAKLCAAGAADTQRSWPLLPAQSPSLLAAPTAPTPALVMACSPSLPAGRQAMPAGQSALTMKPVSSEATVGGGCCVGCQGSFVVGLGDFSADRPPVGAWLQHPCPSCRWDPGAACRWLPTAVPWPMPQAPGTPAQGRVR